LGSSSTWVWDRRRPSSSIDGLLNNEFVTDLGCTGGAPMSFGRNCAGGGDVLGKRQKEEWSRICLG
jgi:hypothetical protein